MCLQIRLIWIIFIVSLDSLVWQTKLFLYMSTSISSLYPSLCCLQLNDCHGTFSNWLNFSAIFLFVWGCQNHEKEVFYITKCNELSCSKTDVSRMICLIRFVERLLYRNLQDWVRAQRAVREVAQRWGEHPCLRNRSPEAPILALVAWHPSTLDNKTYCDTSQQGVEEIWKSV